MTKSHHVSLVASLVWILAVAVSSAVATEREPAAGPLQEIIVTAQKRQQTTVDVPQSISVVSGATLEEQQASGFSDYLKLVPGLQLNQDTPGQGRLVMRGINTGGVASTVAVYLDETPFGSSSGLANGAILAADFDTFDLSRIEVLRGPQGTIYGASSLGGVLKFVTNAPDTGRTLARARVGAASVEGGDMSTNASAVVNLPLSSTVALRVSGTYRKDGGFIDSIGTAGSAVQNNINGSSSYGGRASLLFAPSEKNTFRVSAVFQNIAADSPSIVEADPDTLAPLYGRLSQSKFVPPFTDIAYRLYNGTGNFELGSATLTSSTSYSTQKQTKRDDLTVNLSALIAAIFGTPNNLYLGQNTDVKKFTQELRLASARSGALDWLVGAYYAQEDGLIHQTYNAVEPNSLTPIATLPLLADVNLKSTYKEIAGFANLTAHLSERFDIDFGGRDSHNSQHANQIGDGALAGGPTNFKADSSEDVFTYSVAPKLKFGDHAALYARVAKGFRPGGPNVLPPAAPPGTPATYKSDSVLSYEAGAKLRTPDARFDFDVAVYHINWNSIQLLAVVNNYGVNTNGNGAKSDGAEATATFRPTRALKLSINGAYTNARLDGDTDPIVGGKKGDELPFSPKTSLGFDGDYRWGLGHSSTVFAGASLRWLSTQSGAFDPAFRTANGRQREIPSYSVIDVRTGIDLGKFSIEAYVQNLNGSKGLTSTSAVTANGFSIYPNGAIGVGVIRPRTIGLSLTAEY